MGGRVLANAGSCYRFLAINGGIILTRTLLIFKTWDST
jgi:hypothetical protein